MDMANLPLVEVSTLEAIAESVRDSPEVTLEAWFTALGQENPTIREYLEAHMERIGYGKMSSEERFNHLLPAVMVYQLLKAQAAADTILS